jgi:hypothetical protein
MAGLDPEVLLTHVSIHWLTGTAGSALRIYAEQDRQGTADRTDQRSLSLDPRV